MADKNKKGKKKASKKLNIPVAIAAPLVYMGMTQVAKPIMAGDYKLLAINMTGFDPESQKFNFNELKQTYGPLAIGVVMHKGANRFGVNNYVRKATMGFLSI